MMERFVLILMVALFSQSAMYSQSTKGVTPASKKKDIHQYNNTYALLVGVSKYAADSLDLNYADDDAKAYHEFLQSECGGNVPEKNIKLLLDQEAIRSNIIKGLYWLLYSLEEGDRAIVMFSGHGYTQGTSRNKKEHTGYLLSHDVDTTIAHSEVSKEIASIRIDDFILKLHEAHNDKRKSHLLVVMDACHSGVVLKQNTVLDIINSSKWNEERACIITACKHDEKAYEYSRLERSAFNFFYIKALSGKANDNNNPYMEMGEVEGFVKRKLDTLSISSEIEQTPQFNGSEDIILSIAPEDTCLFDDAPESELANSKNKLNSKSIKEVITKDTTDSIVNNLLFLDNALLAYYSKGGVFVMDYEKPLHLIAKETRIMMKKGDSWKKKVRAQELFFEAMYLKHNHQTDNNEKLREMLKEANDLSSGYSYNLLELADTETIAGNYEKALEYFSYASHLSSAYLDEILEIKYKYSIETKKPLEKRGIYTLVKGYNHGIQNEGKGTEFELMEALLCFQGNYELSKIAIDYYEFPVFDNDKYEYDSICHAKIDTMGFREWKEVAQKTGLEINPLKISTNPVLVNLLKTGASEKSTIHLIIIADKENDRFGISNNVRLMEDFFKDVRVSIGMPLKKHYLKKQNVDMPQLLETIRNVEVGYDDVIWFYYTGSSLNNNRLSIDYIHDQLRYKTPRLLITMFDLSTTYVRDNSEYSFSRYRDAIKLDRLLKNSQGEIKISSYNQDRGSLAYGNEGGSIFIRLFLASLEESLNEWDYEDVIWNNILERSSRKVANFAFKNGIRQIPYYEGNVKYNTKLLESPTPEKREGFTPED